MTILLTMSNDIQNYLLPAAIQSLNLLDILDNYSIIAAHRLGTIANQHNSISAPHQSFLYVTPSSVTLLSLCPLDPLLFRVSITTITIPAMIVKKPIAVNTPPVMTTDKLLRSTPGSG